MASNLKRSRRTVGRRILDLQNKVSGLQKRAGPVSIGQNAVSTSSLQPGAVGGWVVDSDSIYTGTKTATGSYSPTGSITIGSDGHITANKFRIDANGDAFFTGAISGGTIDIGGFDTSSFHVNSSGQMWLGGSTYDNAPFRVSAGGILRSRVVNVNNSTFTSTLSNASYTSEFFDAPLQAYATYGIGPTQLTHTGFWVNSNSLADTAIRERTKYFTNGIAFDGRAAEGGTYGNVGNFYTARGGGNVYTVLDVKTKNNSGTDLQYVQLYDGYVISSRGKAFKMNHPLYPGKQLLHAAIEGPSLDVFYRGSSKLVNGETEIELPDYFEALTKAEGRTITLTAEVLNNSDPVAQLAYSQISDGKFKVFEVNGSINPSQQFSWLVMATRSDSEFEPVVDDDAFPNIEWQAPNKWE